MIISLNEANFEAETSKGTVLIDFYADWCAPCKRMMPKVMEAAEHLKGKITVAKINIDESKELAAKFGVRSIPTFVLIKDGKVVNQSVGSKSTNDLVSFAESLKRGE
tara:strand:+ start:177 stop:497 length:321 start_codon:yes stop_codon:yes gene_type:complete